MKLMEVDEQKSIIAGWTCPLCGFSTLSTLVYSAHGWKHLTESGVF